MSNVQKSRSPGVRGGGAFDPFDRLRAGRLRMTAAFPLNLTFSPMEKGLLGGDLQPRLLAVDIEAFEQVVFELSESAEVAVAGYVR